MDSVYQGLHQAEYGKLQSACRRKAEHNTDCVRLCNMAHPSKQEIKEGHGQSNYLQSQFLCPNWPCDTCQSYDISLHRLTGVSATLCILIMISWSNGKRETLVGKSSTAVGSETSDCTIAHGGTFPWLCPSCFQQSCCDQTGGHGCGFV